MGPLEDWKTGVGEKQPKTSRIQPVEVGHPQSGAARPGGKFFFFKRLPTEYKLATKIKKPTLEVTEHRVPGTLCDLAVCP